VQSVNVGQAQDTSLLAADGSCVDGFILLVMGDRGSLDWHAVADRPSVFHLCHRRHIGGNQVE
jgi:hypothetical protein